MQCRLKRKKIYLIDGDNREVKDLILFGNSNDAALKSSGFQRLWQKSIFDDLKIKKSNQN
jgi:hypothetical protein